MDEIATVITDVIVSSAVSDADRGEKSRYTTKDVKLTLNLRNISLKNKGTRELKHVEKDLKGTLQPGKAFKSNNTKHLGDIYERDDWTFNHSGSTRGRQRGIVYK